jgi:hypothetical protein
MFSAILCTLPLLCGGTEDEIGGSYLYRCRPCAGPSSPCACETYRPQPGDLVFLDTPSHFWDLMDWLAGTTAPDHLGIVVALPDGRPAVLEAGPDAVPRVFLLDAVGRFQAYDGLIWIRRLRCPLTAEQSEALTAFAVRQEGKRYSVLRFARQITPFRVRGPVRTKALGRTHMDRRRWICCDLTITAGTAAGLFDSRHMPANSIYARDILDDAKFNLSDLYEPAARWLPSPPTVPFDTTKLRRRGYIK